MAKKDIVRDVLVKLTNIFSLDLYVVHNYYVLAGNKSNDANRGYYICALEPDVINETEKVFPKDKIVYIPSIKNAKDNIQSIEILTNEEDIKRIELVVEKQIYQFRKPLTWESFHFTEEEIDTLFKSSQSISLFKNDENRSEVIISKSMFPMVTEKTIDKLVYAYDTYEENSELNQLLVIHDTEYFQLMMRYLFIPM